MDEQSLNELLECSVCLERLDHTSKVLQCQHTFCRRCLDEIYSTKRELRCPECRTIVEVPVEELPSNILLIRLLEGLKTKNSERCRSPRRNHEHSSFWDHTSKQQIGNSSQPSARALYNYEASEQSDLSFKKGDVILLKRQVDENWYQGESNNQQGFFPASYVKVIVPLPVTIPQCRGLYDFDVEEEDDKKDCLCFKKDEILTVIKRVDSNWIEGKKGDKIGIFPISFVELNDSAKALINSKNSTNSLGGGDLLSPPNTQFLNPASLAGQLPQQKRHSFTATQDTPTQYQHNRRSLELSSKGNLVIPPTSVSGQVRSPPPLPRTGPERPLNVTDQAGGGSREKTSSRGASLLQEGTRVGSSKTKIFVALYHYKPQKEDEVELRKGDYYSVIEACLDGWFKGRCLKTGKAGVFPGNYVQQARSPSAGGLPNNVQNLRAKTSSSNSKSSSRQEMSSRPEQASSARQDNSASHKQGTHNSRLDGPPSSSSRQEQSAISKPLPTSSSSSSSGSQVPPVKSSHKPHLPPPSSASLSTEANPDRMLNSQMSSTSHTADHLSSQARSVPKPVYIKASKMSPLRTTSSDVQGLAANAVVIPPNSVISKTGPVVGVNGPGSLVPSVQITDPVGASGESSSSNKREKKEKEKLSLVKRLTSGKGRKARSTPDSEGALPSGKVAHTRSGSYPSEVATSVEGQHVKTGSFDSSVHPPLGSKHHKQKSLSREKYRCKEPYPAQHVVELDLMLGDIVYVTKKREDGWFKGTLQRSGKTGLFPGSFVEKVDQ